MVPSSPNGRGLEVQGIFNGAEVEGGKVYYITASTTGTLQIFRDINADEDWERVYLFHSMVMIPLDSFLRRP